MAAPGRFSAAGKEITCVHCGGNLFLEGRAQLNTAALSFLNLDWANRSATTLACADCGQILWFMKRPEKA